MEFTDKIVIKWPEAHLGVLYIGCCNKMMSCNIGVSYMQRCLKRAKIYCGKWCLLYCGVLYDAIHGNLRIVKLIIGEIAEAVYISTELPECTFLLFTATTDGSRASRSFRSSGENPRIITMCEISQYLKHVKTLTVSTRTRPKLASIVVLYIYYSSNIHILFAGWSIWGYSFSYCQSKEFHLP